VSHGRDVSIILSEAQVGQVMREASGSDGSLAGLFAPLGDLQAFSLLVAASLEDRRLSHSTLRALLVLAAFPADGTERSLAAVADTLGYGRSTTHRYVTTWMAVGFLEQEPKSRRYRRASPVRRIAEAENGHPLQA
jgi:hypothetical protein